MDSGDNRQRIKERRLRPRWRVGKSFTANSASATQPIRKPDLDPFSCDFGPGPVYRLDPSGSRKRNHYKKEQKEIEYPPHQTLAFPLPLPDLKRAADGVPHPERDGERVHAERNLPPSPDDRWCRLERRQRQPVRGAGSPPRLLQEGAPSTTAQADPEPPRGRLQLRFPRPRLQHHRQHRLPRATKE